MQEPTPWVRAAPPAAPAPGPFNRAWQGLAAAAVARPWACLAAWLVVVAIALGLARDLPKLLYGSVGVLPGSQAAATEAKLAADFDSPYAQFMILTVEAVTGDDAAGPPTRVRVDRARDALLSAIRREPYVTAAQVIPESQAAQAAILVGIRAGELKQTEKHVAPLRRTIQAVVPRGKLVCRLTGQAPLSLDIVALASHAAGDTERQVLPLTFLALVLSFGAVGASLLPLVAGVASVLLSLGVLAILAHFQQITVYASNVITMLGLGLGIDYALFVVARVREEARAGLAHTEAVTAAIRHAAPAIALSAGTVFLGLAGLASAPARESAGMGLGGMIVAAGSALAALTLLPALARLAGRALDWPPALSRRIVGEPARRRWARLAEAVLRRPWLALAVSLAILLPLAWPAGGLRVGDPDPRLLPQVLESVQGIEVLRRLELGGTVMPFRLVVVPTDGRPALTPRRLRALAALTADLQADQRVQTVFSLVEPTRVTRLATGLALRGEAGLRKALPPEAASLVSRDGHAVALNVVLGPSQGIEEARRYAAELLSRDWAKRYPGLDARVMVGGNAVMSHEFVASAHQTYPRVFAIVGLATLVMLALMTRSLAIALKAVLANALTVAAALGATFWLIHHPVACHWVGLPMPVSSIPAGIPLVAFCIVFGLSMDYEVFLISRIQEAHDRGEDDRAAVVAGLCASGGVITSAAAIMGIVFLGFALTPFLPVKLLGMALVFGVVLDATVVRLLLVPSLMMLLGRWNWWPGDRARA